MAPPQRQSNKGPAGQKVVIADTLSKLKASESRLQAFAKSSTGKHDWAAQQLAVNAFASYVRILAGQQGLLRTSGELRQAAARQCTAAIVVPLLTCRRAPVTPLAVKTLATLARIYPHALPQDLAQPLATLLSDTTYAEDAAQILEALVVPAWGGLGSWGPSAVWEAVCSCGGEHVLLPSIVAWSFGGEEASHRLQLAVSVAGKSQAALQGLLRSQSSAARRWAHALLTLAATRTSVVHQAAVRGLLAFGRHPTFTSTFADTNMCQQLLAVVTSTAARVSGHKIDTVSDLPECEENWANLLGVIATLRPPLQPVGKRLATLGHLVEDTAAALVTTLADAASPDLMDTAAAAIAALLKPPSQLYSFGFTESAWAAPLRQVHLLSVLLKRTNKIYNDEDKDQQASYAAPLSRCWESIQILCAAHCSSGEKELVAEAAMQQAVMPYLRDCVDLPIRPSWCSTLSRCHIPALSVLLDLVSSSTAIRSLCVDVLRAHCIPGCVEKQMAALSKPDHRDVLPLSGWDVNEWASGLLAAVVLFIRTTLCPECAVNMLFLRHCIPWPHPTGMEGQQLLTWCRVVTATNAALLGHFGTGLSLKSWQHLLQTVAGPPDTLAEVQGRTQEAPHGLIAPSMTSDWPFYRSSNMSEEVRREVRCWCALVLAQHFSEVGSLGQLGRDMQKLLKEGRESADVYLVLDDGRVELGLHRIVLATRSSVFAKMLEERMHLDLSTGSSPLHIPMRPIVEQDELQVVLEYLYTGAVVLNSNLNCKSTAKLAQAMGMSQLAALLQGRLPRPGMQLEDLTFAAALTGAKLLVLQTPHCRYRDRQEAASVDIQWTDLPPTVSLPADLIPMHADVLLAVPLSAAHAAAYSNVDSNSADGSLSVPCCISYQHEAPLNQADVEWEGLEPAPAIGLLPAHRCILSARSTFFEALFSHRWQAAMHGQPSATAPLLLPQHLLPPPDQGPIARLVQVPVVQLRDVGPTALRAMLSCLYGAALQAGLQEACSAAGACSVPVGHHSEQEHCSACAHVRLAIQVQGAAGAWLLSSIEDSCRQFVEGALASLPASCCLAVLHDAILVQRLDLAEITAAFVAPHHSELRCMESMQRLPGHVQQALQAGYVKHLHGDD